MWNHRTYRVYGALSHPDELKGDHSMLATTYWLDITESEQMRQTLDMTRPAVAILMIDNYEDLMKACPESKRSALLAEIEGKLNDWCAGSGALLLSYDRDRYLFVMEEKDFAVYAEKKFDVLDTVRTVESGGVSATLSIGVGRDGDSFDGLFKNADLALEMALSRGGDQAVVKDRNNFEFYGGRSKTTEKRTKVKSRVMANALRELIDDARNVYVMGHKYADMDSLGAAAGICCISRKLGKKAQIVIDTENNAAHPVLRDFSADIPAGSMVAVVGSTGAGKTTLVSLLLRFYTPQSGTITIDGLPIQQYTRDGLRRRLAIVLQDGWLCGGTIAENIAYGVPGATRAQIEAAAKAACIHSFLSSLPDGYDTALTDSGAGLSKGQRQLLAIARAAVADPPVMILDEATSSIDTRTEAIVQQGMDSLMYGRTVFVIAHRLSTVRNSNAIMVLENGEIIERGDHDDLLAQKGRYYSLYTGLTELE